MNKGVIAAGAGMAAIVGILIYKATRPRTNTQSVSQSFSGALSNETRFGSVTIEAIDQGQPIVGVPVEIIGGLYGVQRGSTPAHWILPAGEYKVSVRPDVVGLQFQGWKDNNGYNPRRIDICPTCRPLNLTALVS